MCDIVVCEKSLSSKACANSLPHTLCRHAIAIVPFGSGSSIYTARGLLNTY